MTTQSDVSQLSSQQKRELLKQLLRQRESSDQQVFPLSQGQQSLWFIHQLAPDSPAYNFVYAARLQTEVDAAALQRACQRLVDQHPALRTTYETRDGQAVQRVHPHQAFHLAVSDATADSPDQILERLRAEADQPFDLRHGPVLRASLLRRGPEDYVMSLVAHHIAADLWSMDVLVRQLGVLYAAEILGESLDVSDSRASYADYVAWEKDLLASARGEKLWKYWRKKLGGELPVLNLPTDRPRPPVQTYQGDSHSWQLDADTAERIKALARDEQATLFTTLLAAFQAFLYRYSGQHDVLVGTTTASRGRAEWDNVVGYFLNQLVIRGDLVGQPTFRQFLTQSRQRVLEALDHQEYPFQQIVERLSAGTRSQPHAAVPGDVYLGTNPTPNPAAPARRANCGCSRC